MTSIQWAPIHETNFDSASNTKRFIVVHNTANGQSYEGMAANNINYFRSPYRNASASYFIDDGPVIYQAVRDDASAWHCGDAASRNGCNNYNSFGIEVCEGPDGRYTDNEIENLRWLVTRLMDKFDIDADHVVRHHDVTGKNCPWFYTDDAEWSKLHAIITNSEQPEPAPDTARYAQLWGTNGAESQKFILHQFKEGTIGLKVVKTGKYLDVRGSEYKPGTNVIAYRSTSNDNQRFNIVDRGDGLVSIHPKMAPELCLDVSGGESVAGAKVNLWTYNTKERQPNQHWTKCTNKDGTVTFVTAMDLKLILDVQNGGA